MRQESNVSLHDIDSSMPFTWNSRFAEEECRLRFKHVVTSISFFYRKIQSVRERVVRRAIAGGRRTPLVAYHGGAPGRAPLHRHQRALAAGHQDHHEDHGGSAFARSRRVTRARDQASVRECW